MKKRRGVIFYILFAALFVCSGANSQSNENIQSLVEKGDTINRNFDLNLIK